MRALLKGLCLTVASPAWLIVVPALALAYFLEGC